MHADHGYQLGERNIYCKETNYNLATHVPLIVHVPPTHTLHATSRGARTNALVEIVDVMPTVIALAGLPPFDGAARGEAPLGGRSFAALLAAPASASVARAARAALALSAGATLSAATRYHCITRSSPTAAGIPDAPGSAALSAAAAASLSGSKSSPA